MWQKGRAWRFQHDEESVCCCRLRDVGAKIQGSGRAFKEPRAAPAGSQQGNGDLILTYRNCDRINVCIVLSQWVIPTAENQYTEPPDQEDVRATKLLGQYTHCQAIPEV